MKSCVTALAVFFLSCVCAFPASNMLRNASFETQGSDAYKSYYWEWNNPDTHGMMYGSASRETGWRSLSGSFEGVIRGTWAGAYTNGGYWQESPATAGKTYRFTALFWADGVGNQWTSAVQYIKLEFYSSTTGLLYAATNFIGEILPNWMGRSVQAVAPTNTAWARGVIHAAGMGSKGALQFDDVSMIEVPTNTIRMGPSTRRSGLVVSEIMYHPPARADGKDLEFVEIFNTVPASKKLDGYELKGDIDYVFPANTTLSGFTYVVVAKDPSAVQSVYGISGVLGSYTGSLANGEGKLKFQNSLGGEELIVEYSDEAPWSASADGAGHSLILASPSYGEGDPRAWSASFSLGGTPGRGDVCVQTPLDKVVINEFLAHTDNSTGDYIEVYNAGTQSVDLAGCWLSNDAATNKYRITNTVLAAGAFAAWMTNQLGFNFESEGGIILFRGPTSNVIDGIRYTAQQNSVPSGRYPDGASTFQELQFPTKGTNNRPYLARDVAINEIMYHPISENDDDEYIELYNRAASNIDLSAWQFTDGITFTFPAGSSIPAGGYVVVAKNAAHLLAVYTNLTAANLFGDYKGSLANSGERVALAMPHDTNDMVTVDEVSYEDGGRWGSWSDGGGSSLELKDPHSDNRLAPNWADSDETSKSAWTNVTFTGVLDQGMNVWYASIDQLHLLMLRRGECLVDNVVVSNSAGGGNLITNSTFEAGLGGWTLEGNLVRSSLETNGYSSTRSLHVRASGGGDTGANRIKTGLTSAPSPGSTCTISAQARWICGSPYLLLRLRGNYLEATRPLPVPARLGTPAAQNSRYAANVGPAIKDVAHTPILPEANKAVTVRARIHDPDGISSVQLKYRLDPSATVTTLTMSNYGAGVYGAVITGQPAGKLAAFYVTATDSNSATATFPNNAPVRECLIRWGEAQDGSDFGTYRFWLTKTNIDVWAARAPLSDESLDMTLAYNNERVIYNADIRYRGSPFIRPWYQGPLTGINSYVISPPKDDMLCGSDEFNLDTLEPWDGRDGSRVRERTSFWFASRMGLPICYQRLVQIFLNGNQHGDVYADSHHVDSDYTKTWFADDSEGQLFKTDDWFEFGTSYEDKVTSDADLQIYTTTGGEKKKARYRWNWERKANGPYDDNYSNLFALVDTLNLSNASYTAAIESIADVEEWMRVFALRHVVVDWDAYGFRRGKNMFAYRPTEGKWKMLLWDMDMGIGASGESSNNCPVLEVYSNVLPVIARLMGHAPFQRMYWQALYDAVNGPLRSSEYEPFIDEWFEKMQQSGVAAENPAEVKSWLSGRRSFILSSITAVTNAPFAITSNGGSDFSIASNLVALTGTAPIQAREIRINGVTYGLTWTTVTNWTAYIALPAGTNTLSVQAYDSDGNLLSGLSDTIKINYTGTNAAPQGSLVINEIMYNPTEANGGFVEIANRSTNAFDLYNYRLDGVGLVFGKSTVIWPGEYLVIADNAPVFASLYGSSIRVAGEYADALDNGGETLKLVSPSGALVDEVYYDDDPPWPTNADGFGSSLQLIDLAEDNNRIGNWAASTDGALCTPGVSNNVYRDLLPFPNLWINELQATNTSGLRDNAGDRDPWLELYNADPDDIVLTNYYLTDTYTNLVKWKVGANSVVEDGAFHVIWMDAEPGEAVYMTNHASFRLSSTNGSVVLVRSNGSQIVIIDYVNYPAIASDRSYGDFLDGVWTNRQMFSRSSPGATNNVGQLAFVFINEWMASNTKTTNPLTGKKDDWFELYNAGTDAVDLTGYTLTDDFGSPAEVTIPPGYTIDAGAFRVVWASDTNAYAGGTNALNVAFALGKSGDAIGLYTADSVPVDTITFGAQSSDVSQGRWWDGQSGIYTQAIPTPGAPNIVSTNNSAPVLSFIGAKGVDEEEELEFQVLATDTDTPLQRLTFSLEDAPQGAEINSTNGWFEWEPEEADGPMVTSVTIRVTDNGWTKKSDFETFTITVNEVNEKPEIKEIKDVWLNPGSLLVIGVTAEDEDIPANALTFSLDPGYPDGASITTNGMFSWRPSDSQFWTTNTIVVHVTDNGLPPDSDTETFVVEVSGMDELFSADVTSLPGTNGFIVTWNAISGETYRVDYQQTLFDSTWSNLPPDILASNIVASTLDTTTNSVTQRFYRILRLLP